MSNYITYLNHSNWPKKPQTKQTVMNSATHQAEWPSRQRRQTQKDFSVEIPGTRMCAWVRVPLLSNVFK